MWHVLGLARGGRDLKTSRAFAKAGVFSDAGVPRDEMKRQRYRLYIQTGACFPI
jgi:hypothetical protein